MLAAVGDELPPGPWDVAVVGGGIGGLVAASCLARHGRRVVLLEAGGSVGGYLASFQRQGVTFDACVDAVGSVFEPDGSPGLFGRVLESAGVLEDVDWIELDPIRTQRFPNFDFVIPRGFEKLQDTLEKLFPDSRFALRRVLEAMAAIHAMPRMALGLPCRQKPVRDFRDEPFGAFLARFPLSLSARAALGSYATFLGISPYRVSTRAISDLWMSYVEGGAWRVRGGFGCLATALAAKVLGCGGHVVTSCRVTATERTGYGWRIRMPSAEAEARSVIWAAAPADVSRGCLSSSFAILYALITTNDGLQMQPSMGLYPSEDPALFYRTEAFWKGAGGISAPVDLAEEPARDGVIPVIVHWPVEPETLAMVPKKEIKTALLRLLGQHLDNPDVRWAEAATPVTLQRYSGNPGGVAYGWEQSPDGILGPIEATRVPGEGPILAGQWAGMGGGVVPSAISGWRAAARVLRQSI